MLCAVCWTCVGIELHDIELYQKNVCVITGITEVHADPPPPYYVYNITGYVSENVPFVIIQHCSFSHPFCYAEYGNPAVCWMKNSVYSFTRATLNSIWLGFAIFGAVGLVMSLIAMGYYWFKYEQRRRQQTVVVVPHEAREGHEGYEVIPG